MIFCKLCVYTICCMLICQSWMKYWKCSRGRLMYYLFFPSFISQFPIFLLYFIFLYMGSMYITVHIMEACNKDYYYYYYYYYYYNIIQLMWMVSCQKGPTGHAYAWQIRLFWQDTLELSVPHQTFPLNIAVLLSRMMHWCILFCAGAQCHDELCMKAWTGRLAAQ